jgi:hypothetical protein
MGATKAAAKGATRSSPQLPQEEGELQAAIAANCAPLFAAREAEIASLKAFSAVVEECWGRGEEGRWAELTCYFNTAHHTLTTVPARQLSCWSVVRVPGMDSKQEVMSKV